MSAGVAAAAVWTTSATGTGGSGERFRIETPGTWLPRPGGPILIVLEGEGMLRMRDYPAGMREGLAAAAADAGVGISRGLRTVAATDALIALRAGYRVVTLASVDHTKLPLNYHWPSDTPDALCWDTVEDAIAVCERFLRLRARGDTLSVAD